ncbi:type II toxin-antitoxin system PemK/MazF family toxin [Candidatus Kaiserbacteria bacterium]|nr:MAG: type II toxin-antitoxin system PemK/MazF family toxin [Candidatus Kaiserbacteria bacterium]
MYKKQFNEWNTIKKNVDTYSHKPPLFKDREIWWCTFGVNVGSEECGKNLFFRRPVLVIKKLSQTSFIGVPLSTKSNSGSWYVDVTHSDGLKNTANVAQVRYIDYRRLDKRIGTLDSIDFKKVQDQLGKVLGI